MANRSSNTTAVPEAKGALDRFKFEVANELGVPLSERYNGNLTSKPVSYTHLDVYKRQAPVPLLPSQRRPPGNLVHMYLSLIHI